MESGSLSLSLFYIFLFFFTKNQIQILFRKKWPFFVIKLEGIVFYYRKTINNGAVWCGPTQSGVTVNSQKFPQKYFLFLSYQSNFPAVTFLTIK